MAPRQRFLLIAVVALAAIAISAQVALSSPWLTCTGTQTLAPPCA